MSERVIELTEDVELVYEQYGPFLRVSIDGVDHELALRSDDAVFTGVVDEEGDVNQAVMDAGFTPVVFADS